VSTESNSDSAPALRGGASSDSAPALRGGASSDSAPALRGGASLEQPPVGVEQLVLWHRAGALAAGEADALAFRKQVDARIQVAGGEVIARAGSTLAAVFDPLELDDVIDLALGLLRDAQTNAARIEVACGLALGELVATEQAGAPAGSAIDRAQRLANQCAPFELVLDDAARARAEDSHLFVRALRIGDVVGHTLDRNHPQKQDARRSLAAVRPAELAPGVQGAFARVRELASRPGQQRIALRTMQPHVALFWLEQLRQQAAPSLVLQLGPQAAALQPLGGLQLALRRAGHELDPLLDVPLREVIARLITGAAVPRGETVVALRELLKRAGSGGKRAFIVLDRMREIDRPSLAIVAEALQQTTGDPVLWLLADEHEGIPSALFRAGEHDEVAIEPLAIDDRARVAEMALGLPTGSDIALRVARLGGDTTLGVWAAARTLVGSGDLVLDGSAGSGFRWRNKARHASLPVPIDALLTECAAGLQPQARRALEALCVAPPCGGLKMVARIALLDGLSADTSDHGIDQLVREGWVDARGELGPLQHAVCSAVRNGMPPARAAELHRFVAEVLSATPEFTPRASFARALLAHHLAEGGRDKEAAGALLDAAQAATESGFERMAVRLAAFALKLDRSSESKQRARSVANTVDSGPLATSVPPPRLPTEPPLSLDSSARQETASEPRAMASAAIRSAIHAIVRGEHDAAEGFIDTAVAAGWGRAGAQRLWSVAQLRKGSLPDAVRTLKQAHVESANPGTRSREAITAGLILLEAGECVDAVRSLLEALASARRAHETLGERAALELLSACFRLLDREADAERIANAAATVSAAAG
jgi:hypothetical protein